MNKKKKIGAILVEMGRLTTTHLKDALRDQVDSSSLLGEILVAKGILKEREIAEALGFQFSLPVVDLEECLADPTGVDFLPRTMMERQRVFSLGLRESDTLLVAIADPLDLAAREELRAAASYKIQFALATERDIDAALAATAARSRIPKPLKKERDLAPEPREDKKTPLPETARPALKEVIDVSRGPSEPEISSSKFPVVQKLRPKLGEIFVQWRAVSEEQVAEALQRQTQAGMRLGEILLSRGLVTEVKLAEALSTQLRIPLLMLTRYTPMPEALKSIPRNAAARLQLVPLSIERNTLLVAMADPLDLLAQDEVRILTGCDLRLCVTTPAEIENNLDRLYDLQDNLEDAIVEIKDFEFPAADHFMETQANDAPVIQLVSNVLRQAVREEASDIHVEPCKKTGRIRFRVDGVLYNAFDYPLTLHPAVSARVKIMAGMDIAERRKPQDGRILIKTAGRFIDLRASSVPTTRGEKIVLRILDQENSAVGLERLGLEPDDMEKINAFCTIPWGVLLATGPTGSGKSTTLYSILEKINHLDINIVTVEDPVEYSLDGVSQIHVNEKAGVSFDSALRSILRQDPDKIMVGEIRDQETAQITIRAALTGHFVLSTLHTNDAPSALTRMTHMGVAPYLVSASVCGVIAQRLVRKLCPFCKEEYEVDPYTCDALKIPRGAHAWKAKGCNECRQGYKGRKGIYEILAIDDDLRGLILAGANHMQIRDAAIAKGMKTLRQSGINNALAGLTSMEEVFATTLQ
ncbi:MAG: type II/IV secretion system protein [Synergistaceae bacterium]|jgi:type IV pilus assembly protein PilB|nr:type II/IV secretion system protein [Synergistaceae bacterium]